MWMQFILILTIMPAYPLLWQPYFSLSKSLAILPGIRLLLSDPPDYLYIPLGGNRVSHSRWLINIFITFVISGLWHGANWTFIIWGAMNGVFLIVELVLFKRNRKALISVLL